MAPRTAKKRATYADIVALPEHLVGQIIDGELIVQPRPATDHAHSATLLTSELSGPFQLGRNGPGGWWILFEPELHLGRDVLVPDIAGWRRDVMPVMRRMPYFTIAPQWLCEVLSPSTARVDRARKLRKYARYGVDHVWLVDPDARTLEVFRRSEHNWLLVDIHEDDARVRAEPFDAIEIDLAAFWLPEDEGEPAAVAAKKARKPRRKSRAKRR
jgi:Uma2 family endonuclease